MKIAICAQHGGFSLSEAVREELESAGCAEEFKGYRVHDQRADPRLIAAIEKVGLERAGGGHCTMAIVEIPDDVEWYIHEWDGLETVHEKHRTWPKPTDQYNLNRVWPKDAT